MAWLGHKLTNLHHKVASLARNCLPGQGMGRRLEAWRGQGTAREYNETGREEEEQHLRVCFRVTGRDGWLGFFSCENWWSLHSQLVFYTCGVTRTYWHTIVIMGTLIWKTEIKITLCRMFETKAEMDWHSSLNDGSTKMFKMYGILVMTHFQLRYTFSLNRPLCRFSLQVVMSVTMSSVCPPLETLLPGGLETSGQREYR